MATVDFTDTSFLQDPSQVSCVSSGAVDDAAFLLKSENQYRWDEIDSRLKEWMASPEEEDEDGYISPSSDSVRIASRLLNTMRATSFSLPPSVVVNGDGGIAIKRAFELAEKHVVEVEEDGSLILRIYQNNRVIEQRPIAIRSCVNLIRNQLI